MWTIYIDYKTLSSRKYDSGKGFHIVNAVAQPMSGRDKKQSIINAVHKLEADSADRDDFDELFTPSSIAAIAEFEKDLEIESDRESTSETSLDASPNDSDVDVQSESFSLSTFDDEMEASVDIPDSFGLSANDEDFETETQLQSIDHSNFDDEAEASVDIPDPFGVNGDDEDFETQVESFSHSNFENESEVSVDDSDQFAMESDESDYSTDAQASAFSDLEYDNEFALLGDVSETDKREAEDWGEEVDSDVSLRTSNVEEIEQTNSISSVSEHKQLADADKKEIKNHLKRVLTEKILESIDSHLDGLQVNIGNDIKPHIEPDNLRPTYSYNLTPLEYGYVYNKEKIDSSSNPRKRGKVSHEVSDEGSVSRPYELTEELDLELQFSEDESEAFNDIDEDELVDQLSQLPISETKKKRDYGNILLVIFLIFILVTGIHGYYQSDQVSSLVSDIENNISTFTANVAKNIDSFTNSGQ